MNVPFQHDLTNLKADRSGKWTEATKYQAPQKPLLLLSVLDGIEQGWIPDNRIKLSQELIETFSFYWQAVMGKEKSTTIALPFYHLNSAPFWSLRYKSGEKEMKTSPSIGGLQKRVEYAELNPELFQAMSDSSGRQTIRLLLLAYYFSSPTAKIIQNTGKLSYDTYSYSQTLLSYVDEPFELYHPENENLTTYISERQVRDRSFSWNIRKLYNYQCAVCRNRIITESGNILVHGAHIFPHYESNNNDPRNGISLCPSHHWMFDKWLITVKPDYKLELSRQLKDSAMKVSEIWEWEGKTILLPEDQRFYPDEQALQYHFERFRDH